MTGHGHFFDPNMVTTSVAAPPFLIGVKGCAGQLIPKSFIQSVTRFSLGKTASVTNGLAFGTEIDLSL